MGGRNARCRGVASRATSVRLVPADLAAGSAKAAAGRQPAAGQDRQTPPNVVIIFCDDLGYSDIGCFGSGGFRNAVARSIGHRGPADDQLLFLAADLHLVARGPVDRLLSQPPEPGRARCGRTIRMGSATGNRRSPMYSKRVDMPRRFLANGIWGIIRSFCRPGTASTSISGFRFPTTWRVRSRPMDFATCL